MIGAVILVQVFEVLAIYNGWFEGQERRHGLIVTITSLISALTNQSIFAEMTYTFVYQN